MNEIKALFRNPLAVVLAALVVVALGLWVYQLATASDLTGMNNSTSWGLYLMCFMFFDGLAAGSLIIASVIVLFRLERLQRAVLPALACALGCVVCTGLCILLDLGNFPNMWRMIVNLHITSPLAWDMISMVAFIVVAIAFLYFRCSAGADARKERIAAGIALPVAVLLCTVASWVFGLQIAREAWNTSILAPIFLVGSLDSALALVLLVLLGVGKARGEAADGGVISGLVAALCVCVALDFYLIVCELAFVGYNGTEAGNAILGLLTSGSLAPFFWIEVVGGLAIPFVILANAKNRGKGTMVAAASALVLCGVFCKRVWLMLSGFAFPNVAGAAGIPGAVPEGVAATVWSTTGQYAPTAPEVLVCVGVFALAALIVVSMLALFAKPAVR